MLTGLMYSRPEDPISYLECCLQKVRELGGPEKVQWDTFLGPEQHCFPSLSGGQGKKPFFQPGRQNITQALVWSGTGLLSCVSAVAHTVNEPGTWLRGC